MTGAEREAIINELIIDNNTNQVTPAKVREVLKVLNEAIQIADPAAVYAIAPLVLNPFNNQFSMPKASETQDGYISKEDFQKLGGSIYLHDYVSTGDTFSVPFGVTISHVYISQGWRYPRTQWVVADGVLTLIGTSSVGKRVDLIGMQK